VTAPMSTCPKRPVRPDLSFGTLALGAITFGTLGALALTACAPADDLRHEVLTHLADEVFVPAHARLRDEAAALAAATARHCQTDDRAAATRAWSSARAAWSFTAAFAFGPVVTQRQAGALDFWPARTDTIEAKILAAPAVIDAAYIDSLGTSAKGLPALEYLLFAGDTRPGTPRCAYATALAADIERRCEALAVAWVSHAEDLKTASGAYASDRAALDAVVNATIENLYRMVKDKLDRPLGNLSGGAPDPLVLESRFRGGARDDLEANLRGFLAVYLGADGEPGGEPGLGALVAARDPDLDRRILAQHELARASLAAIPLPVAVALVEQRSAVQTARDEIDALRRLIKLDVASLLGVTLSLSDNDGD